VSSDEPLFLDVEDVIEIHATQLEVFGGSAGLRDRGLLESAVAQPQTSFGGEFAHDGLFAMAAAYLFLDVNGNSIDHPSDALYELTMGVAEGRIDKAAIAAESNASRRRGRR
jgi:death on curing protein